MQALQGVFSLAHERPDQDVMAVLGFTPLLKGIDGPALFIHFQWLQVLHPRLLRPIPAQIVEGEHRQIDTTIVRATDDHSEGVLEPFGIEAVVIPVGGTRQDDGVIVLALVGQKGAIAGASDPMQHNAELRLQLGQLSEHIMLFPAAIAPLGHGLEFSRIGLDLFQLVGGFLFQHELALPLQSQLHVESLELGEEVGIVLFALDGDLRPSDL